MCFECQKGADACVYSSEEEGLNTNLDTSDYNYNSREDTSRDGELI